MDAPHRNLSPAIERRFAQLRRSYLPGREGQNFRASEYALCTADPVHWVNHWVWTYDPRERDNYIPFDLFARQEAYLRWLVDRESRREDGLVEKARDMGATWLCAAYAVHGWLFRTGFACGFGSRKLELVDQLGTHRSILEKCRIILDFLPGWMLPRGYDRKKHAIFCRIVNPVTGASIIGEGGDNIGRGDRASIYFVDEAAHLERPELVEQSLSATTNVRIDVSTPRGVGNPFWRKRFSGMVEVFTFRWTDDPRKSQEWYDRQKATRDRVTVAQEIDLDYSASVEGVIIPGEWVRAAVRLPLKIGSSNQGGLDVAGFGKDSSVLATRSGPVVFTLLSWEKQNTTQTAWRARDDARRQETEHVYYDVVGMGEGVRGVWDSEEKLGFTPVAVNGGETPTSTRWPDGRTSQEIFVNRRAELWWLLRERFEKTFERVTGKAEHPDEECISIPNDPELIAQLSMPLAEFTSKGKIKVESKDDMRKRGVKSPDRADALCLAFHPLITLPRGSWGVKVY